MKIVSRKLRLPAQQGVQDNQGRTDKKQKDGNRASRRSILKRVYQIYVLGVWYKADATPLQFVATLIPSSHSVSNFGGREGGAQGGTSLYRFLINFTKDAIYPNAHIAACSNNSYNLSITKCKKPINNLAAVLLQTLNFKLKKCLNDPFHQCVIVLIIFCQKLFLFDLSRKFLRLVPPQL